MKSILTALLSLFFYSTNGTAQIGSLDILFAEAGFVEKRLGEDSKFSRLFDLISLPSGGFVTLSNVEINGLLALQLSSFQEDGSIDTTFGENGNYLIEFDNKNIQGTSMQLTKEGHIIVGGKISEPNKPDPLTSIFFTKHDAQGFLDANFGDKGRFITAETNTKGSSVSVVSMALQTDKKIVFGCPLDINTTVLSRLNSDGTVDESFGNKGVIDVRFSDALNELRALAVQPNGNILLAGYVVNSSKETKRDFAILRTTPDGFVDTTFGTEGVTIIDFNQQHEEVEAIAIQSDGKIILGGQTNSGFKSDFALVRLNVDGQIDTTYGNQGKRIIPISESNSIVFQSTDILSSLIMQEDDKLVLVGGTTQVRGIHSDLVLVRVLENGTLDNDFGTAGKYILDFGELNGKGIAAFLQKEDKLMVGSQIWDSRFTFIGYNVSRHLLSLNVGTVNFSTNTNNVLLYPNPIKNTTTLEYTLEALEPITVQLTDLQGKILQTYLQNQPQAAGDYQQAIELPADLPRGMYFVRLSSPTGQLMVKVIK
ncbi:MAG: T9SS type A sorting domain-containing protein [Bacteroidota bacterium]